MNMRSQGNRRIERLHAIAAEQDGYFTAKQARASGYKAGAQSYHVSVGNWSRERRGIYRLKNYPAASRPDLILWSLWSANRAGEPQSVYSHATALSIHELSDLNPAKLHMTVPPGFRRSGPLPKVLVLHKARMHPDDIERMHGFRVTRPLRTICDLVAAGATEEDHLRQAVREAIRRGLVSIGQIERAIRTPRPVKERVLELAR
ncbi:MAG: hypothetical protein HY079_12560 [Elusimicrobia bacterium]|nr:hypothetical protein [Elusimicrobiota bacterium]